MSIRKKKGFTLIELVAVLVIMAIIALIVTPLVMSIIRKAKISADKRSIDAYGRSIELAIAGYLLDNGTFPTSIEQLTIEYSGDEVVCSQTQLNPDSSVYLAGCTVDGRNIDYAYGENKIPVTYDEYSIGDEIIYNNVEYYVIKDSSASEETVQLLKKEPLTVAEVNQYGEGHINRYTDSSVGTAYNSNGYGGMAYYTSETCGYVNSNYIDSLCTTDYEQSEVKYVVDAWKTAQAPQAIEARLITYDDLTDNLGYEKKNEGTIHPSSGGTTPAWVYNSNYSYWTESQYNDSASSVWYVDFEGRIIDYRGYFSIGMVVRPVITLSKTNISS